MSDPSRPGSARERLLQAAAELFYAHGIAATGIDAITDRAGVAKKSLYNNFSSKADLVSRYLEARHAEWLALYAERRLQARDPRGRILAVFDAYSDHAGQAYIHGFRGCGLLNAAAELEASDPGRQAVRHHKEEVEGIVRDALTAGWPHKAAETGRLAAQIAFLLEGAVVRAGLEGHGARLVEARAMAADLLEGL